MHIDLALVACRSFFVLGVIVLLGSWGSHAHWILWAVGVCCLLVSFEAFLRYKKNQRETIRAREDGDGGALKKNMEHESGSLDIDRWEDEGGSHF
ncbi:MAG: hypothetical protein Q8O83_03870 [bacterium]|nr:hypothetical protein [bacterium]